jgi:hypothetical protein
VCACKARRRRRRKPSAAHGDGPAANTETDTAETASALLRGGICSSLRGVHGVGRVRSAARGHSLTVTHTARACLTRVCALAAVLTRMWAAARMRPAKRAPPACPRWQCGPRSSMLLRSAAVFRHSCSSATLYRVQRCCVARAMHSAPSADNTKKRSMVRIGTHDGTFHCDEALGVYILRRTAVRPRSLSLVAQSESPATHKGALDLSGPVLSLDLLTGVQGRGGCAHPRPGGAERPGHSAGRRRRV